MLDQTKVNRKDQQEEWDLIIRPPGNKIKIDLKEIWHYKDLIWMFMKRDFAAQYKQTILGPLWHIIQPLCTTLIFVVVFSNIAAISTDGLPPVLFYLSGLTIWNYFSGCLQNTSTVFVANAYIFGKVYFPRLVMPISIVVSNLVKFFIQFLLLLAVIVWYNVDGVDIHIDFSLLYIPFLLIIMAGISLGLGIIISSLTTKYRDFTVLVTFGVQLLMYATPVVYPLSMVQNDKLKYWLTLNPLSSVVESFRCALLGVGNIDTGSLLYSTLFMFSALIVGLLVFSKVERTFMDTV
jgi:lipopolysaccharide transport system permease protein